MRRRRPSPRVSMALVTLMCGGALVAIVVSRSHDTAAYRHQTAPDLYGVVSSAGVTQRRMSCGRSTHGYSVDVTVTIDETTAVEPLPTCHPGDLPPNTRVHVWERQQGVLTLASPQHAAQVYHLFVGGIVVLWLALTAVFLRADRRGRVEG